MAPAGPEGNIMDILESIERAARNVREGCPLVHNITNYVTVNDCANALLACGASPIMSDDIDDVVDITSICGGLVLNIGTLNARTVESMFAAGERSAQLGHPIVLDPVGAGASAMRTETASSLLDRLPVAVVRGNMSEVKALAGASSSTRGVDVCPEDAVVEGNVSEAASFAREFAAKAGSAVAITGAIDIVADENRAFAVRNGSALQGKITGAGCMLSSITGAFAVANPGTPLEAALAAVCLAGVAGQVAESRMGEMDGNGSFRAYLLDALCTVTPEKLAEMAAVEEVA